MSGSEHDKVRMQIIKHGKYISHNPCNHTILPKVTARLPSHTYELLILLLIQRVKYDVGPPFAASTLLSLGVFMGCCCFFNHFWEAVTQR